MRTLRPLALLVFFLFPVAAPGQPPTEYAPPTPEVIAAWEKAGAQYGGWSFDAFGFAAFTPKKELAKGEMPGFDLPSIDSNTNCVDPGVPVGLGLKEATDGQLRRLAGLKNLQLLDLDNTQVTDVGLKELAGLKNLQKLYLGYMCRTEI